MSLSKDIAIIAIMIHLLINISGSESETECDIVLKYKISHELCNQKCKLLSVVTIIRWDLHVGFTALIKILRHNKQEIKL